MEIFKNTCVFTVRLHLGLIDKAKAQLARTLSFAISEQYPSGSACRALGSLIWGLSRVRKSIPQRSHRHLEGYLLGKLKNVALEARWERGRPIPGMTTPPGETGVGPRHNRHIASIVDRGA